MLTAVKLKDVQPEVGVTNLVTNKEAKKTKSILNFKKTQILHEQKC